MGQEGDQEELGYQEEQGYQTNQGDYGDWGSKDTRGHGDKEEQGDRGPGDQVEVGGLSLYSSFSGLLPSVSQIIMYDSLFKKFWK